MEYLDSAVAAVRLLLGRVKLNATRFSGRRRGGQRWRQVGAMNWNGLFSRGVVCLGFFLTASRWQSAACLLSLLAKLLKIHVLPQSGSCDGAAAGGVHAGSAAAVAGGVHAASAAAVL